MRLICSGIVAAYSLLTITGMSSTSLGAEKLIFSCAAGPPLCHSEGRGFHGTLMAEALGRLGTELTVTEVPGERALRNLAAGIDDGNFPRIRKIADLYPNLVIVDESLLRVDHVGLTTDPEVDIDGWDDLKHHHVGLVRGFKVFEEKAAGAKSVTAVRDVEQLLLLLKKGRVDVVVHEKFQGVEAARLLQIDDLRVLDPPFQSIETFAFMHSKHKRIACRLAATIRDMKQDGSYQRIYNEKLQPHLR